MLEVAQKYLQLKSGEYYKCFGKVDKVVGLTIESIGPKAKLNDLCMIFLDKERRDYVMSEVVGFKDSHIILMPFDNVEGVGVGCIVENTGHPLTVAVGDELLGHTVDGIGRVTDCDEKDLKLDSEYPIEAPPPDPMSREIISDVLPLGVKAVDGLITVGKGQRIGIFAGSGVGKSTLLGMFARNTKADINVIALIGERGREVREFIERDLGPEGMARSVVVVATSDKPALIRNKAAKTATSIAEYFRDKGEDVLLMMDFLIGSFMVNDKLSHKDLDKIADMSAEELKIITEKEVTAAKKDLSDALDEEITQKQDETKRSLEKEANSKIMAINEYSDTVLDSINKAHNEIMFLYSMLNDKHDELTRLSGDIDKASSRLRSSFEPLSADSAKRAEKPSVAVQKPAEPKSGTMQQDTKPDMKQMTGIDISGIIKTQPASAAPASKAGATTATGTAAAVSVKASDAAFGTPAGSSANADVINHTHEILKLYKSGKSNVEIAKLLSLGTGEVKLIIDLYKEGK